MQNDVQHPQTDEHKEARKQAQHEALVNRIAELEQRVAELEGRN